MWRIRQGSRQSGEGVRVMAEPLVFVALWILIYSYLILASVDFGASFYLFYGQVFQKKERMYALLDDYLSPVSEVANICFVLLFAAVLSFSPDVSLVYQTPFLFTGIVAALLTLLKGTFYAMAELLSKKSGIRAFCVAGNGLTGVLIPPVLSIAMVVSEGGFSGTGNVAFFMAQLGTNLYFWSVIVISIVSIFYISAMYFAHFARSCNNETLSDGMRNIALFWSMPTVAASGFVFLGLERQNPDHFMNALNFSWMFLLSLIFCLLAVTLLFLKRHYRLSFLFVMLQYLFALMGYSLSHLPYVIYPEIQLAPDLIGLSGSAWFISLTMALAVAVVASFLILKRSIVRRNAAFKRSNSK